MKTRLHKVLSIILVAVMLLSALPFTASAEEITGSCGDNLTWSLDSSAGSLTISGTGDMYDYADSSSTPWSGNIASIRVVSINEGVTNIGASAFCDCINLVNITIPVSVISVGDDAFNGCMAFDVYYLGNQSQWESIVIAEGNDVLSEATFMFFGQTETSSDDESVVSTENVYTGTCGSDVTWTLYENSGKLVLSGSGSTNDYDPIAFFEYASWYKYSEFIKSIVIEEGITRIGAYTFYELPNVESVKFPDSMRSISAFCDCDSIKNIEVGNNITSLSASTFSGTAFYKDESNWENGVLYLGNCLVDVKTDFSGEFVLKENTRLIAAKAFYNCVNITSITMPTSVLYINANAFSGCTGLSSAFYPGTLSQWEQITVGTGNDNLTNYLLIDTLSERPHFLPGKYGPSTTWLLYDDGEFLVSGSGSPYYDYSGDGWTHLKPKIKKVVISDGVREIDSSAFKDCNNLVEVIISESVTAIWHSAFENCTSLKSITIPSQVTNIYGGTFYNCTSLENVIILGEIMTVGSEAFRNTALPFDGNELYIQGHLVELKESVKGHYTVREGTIGIGGSVFEGMDEMTSITIPEGVSYIGGGAFRYCTGLTELTIPEGCTKIYDEAFWGCSGLEFLRLPLSLKYVEREDALYLGGDSQKILYPGNSSQWHSISIGYNSDYSYLNYFILECDSDRPYYYKSYSCGSNAFTKLYADGELLVYGNGDMNSSYYIDYDFPNYWNWNYKKSVIKTITISDGITLINSGVFSGCNNLASARIPASVDVIESNAFNNCPKLETIYFGGTQEEWEALGYDDWSDLAPKIYFNVAHEHSYISKTIEESTCVDVGTKQYECYCGDSYTEVLPILNHTLETYYSAPTCTSQGYECDKCTVCGEEFNLRNYEATIDHIWANKYVVPTCSAEGYSCLECTTCGEEKDITVLAKLQHTPLEWVEISAATCNEVGVTVQRCTVCNTEVDRKETSALGHSTYIWIIGEQATCEDDGYKVKKCSICSVEFDREVIPALGHTSGDWEFVSDPTCTEIGVTAKKCLVCQAELERMETAALGHTPDEWKVETEANCQNDGCKVQRCIICLEILNSEVIPSTDHISSGWVILSEPSCKEVGLMVQSCKLCNTELERIENAALGHTPGEWTVESDPTCEHVGFNRQRCTVCLEILNSQIIPKTDHISAGWETVIEPTCEVAGLMVQKCKFCETEIERIETSKLDHTPGDWEIISEPTCKEVGVTVQKCSVCQAEIKRVETPATGHTLGEWQVENQATCDKTGLKTQKCNVCFEVVNSETIPSPDHIPGEWETISEPDCETIGVSVQKCTVCLNEINREETPAFGHTLGEWVIELSPTCTSYGLNVQRCLTCKKVVNNTVISKTSHTLGEWTVESESTCNKAGLKVQNCTVCKNVVNSEEIPTVDHNYEHHYTAPSCTSTGREFYTCLTCGESTEQVVLEKIEHDKLVVRTEPTCNSTGVEYYVCSMCGFEIGERVVLPKTEHKYYEWVIKTVPTATQDGEKSRICSNCVEVQTQAIPAIGFETANGLQMDFKNNIVYGLDAGCVSLDGYTTMVDDSYVWSYDTIAERLGTGSKAVLKDGETIVGEYTVVIFGDVNGDGWYDGTDSIIVSCLANGMLTEDDVSVAAYEAADCNHDGVVDSFDVALLEKAGALLASVDQAKSTEELATDEAYIEYVELIDQSPEMEETAPEENIHQEQPQESQPSILDFIIELIKSIINMIIAYIPLPIK
ncbi:MAG: leucine-rich repeat protein [Clostridia bacterium]|nr:leucine-rich repeat protein [Clostridia bacterium]